jgi:hypothetical protein
MRAEPAGAVQDQKQGQPQAAGPAETRTLQQRVNAEKLILRGRRDPGRQRALQELDDRVFAISVQERTKNGQGVESIKIEDKAHSNTTLLTSWWSRRNHQ